MVWKHLLGDQVWVRKRVAAQMISKLQVTPRIRNGVIEKIDNHAAYLQAVEPPTPGRYVSCRTHKGEVTSGFFSIAS